jgi:hypothetical protein
MKVRTCERCPYTPGDLAGYYDSGAERLCCMVCEVSPVVVLPGTYPIEENRRGRARQC